MCPSSCLPWFCCFGPAGLSHKEATLHVYACRRNFEAGVQSVHVLDAAACCVQVLMVDHVIAADGHSYERAAIQAVLRKSMTTSPVTGCMLPHMEVMPNIALKKTISRFAGRYCSWNTI